jgi:hypothetical protein
LSTPVSKPGQLQMTIPTLIMFEYYDIIRNLEASGHKDSSNMHAWLNFALKNKIVAGIHLERDEFDTVWIGLTPQSTDELNRSAKCVAKRFLTAAWGSIKLAVFEPLIANARLGFNVVGTVIEQMPVIASALFVVLVIYTDKVFDIARS